MIVKYEDLNEYIAKLEMLPKDCEVYISVGKDVSETGIVAPTIVLQVFDKTDNRIYVYFYDDLSSFQVIPRSTLDVMPNAEQVRNSYNENHDKFEKEIDVEFKKFVTLMKDNIGFKHVFENISIVE